MEPPRRHRRSLFQAHFPQFQSIPVVVLNLCPLLPVDDGILAVQGCQERRGNMGHLQIWPADLGAACKNFLAFKKWKINHKCWRGCGEGGTLLCFRQSDRWGGCSGRQFGGSSESHIQSPRDPAAPPPGTHPEELGTGVRTNPYTWVFVAAPFTLAKWWKRPKCPSEDKG